MRKPPLTPRRTALLALVALSVLSGCSQGSPQAGASPTAASSGHPAVSPSAAAGPTMTATGAVSTTFGGRSSCIISTSVTGTTSTRTLIFSGIRAKDGWLVYLSVYPYTGSGTYTNFSVDKAGTHATISSYGHGSGPTVWSAASGHLTVSEAGDTAGGTVDAELQLAGTASPGSTHLAGPWACSLQRAAAPSTTPTASPSPSR